MRTIENYELVVSGENDEKLLLTFDWADLPQLPRAATQVTLDQEKSRIVVSFEDDKHWEEIEFVALPLSLQDLLRNFDKIFVVGLSDEVEMFSEVALTFA